MATYDLLTPPAAFFNFSLLIFDILPTIKPSAERASARDGHYVPSAASGSRGSPGQMFRSRKALKIRGVITEYDSRTPPAAVFNFNLSNFYILPTISRSHGRGSPG